MHLNRPEILLSVEKSSSTRRRHISKIFDILKKPTIPAAHLSTKVIFDSRQLSSFKQVQIFEHFQISVLNYQVDPVVTLVWRGILKTGCKFRPQKGVVVTLNCEVN